MDARLGGAEAAAAVAQEVERQPCDLVVLGYESSARMETAGQILQASDHHLLLIPQERPTPVRVLICAAAGEPGKEDVLFAGRLVRHLGAEATLLTVLPKGADTQPARQKAARFLEAGARTLGILGVSAGTLVRAGSARAEITSEMASGNYDMLVLGAPLPDREGRISLSGLVGQLLASTTGYPVLIVRSHYVLGTLARLASAGHPVAMEEGIP
jgi:nucleotide-binding universal stress UspA family protein